LQRGNDLARHATFFEPALTEGAAATMAPDTAFNTAAKFNGGVQASVLYIEDGPVAAGCPAAAKNCTATTRAAGSGAFFASASSDVYAIDETSGLTVWHAALTGAGDGIRGTPVIDPASRTMYVAFGAGGHHEIHALSVDDGSERTGWPVILSTATLTANGVQFNSGQQNEHGALLFNSNTGILYVPFGGEYGDGGNYRGWVVAIDTSDPTRFAGWVSADQQSGIWGHGGLASDGTSIFAETGNGHRGSLTDANSDSEEVVRLTGMAAVAKSAANIFVSPNWQYMDGTDKDFGASTPAYTTLPAGSNPASVLVAPAKPGHLYFLNGANLGSSLADLVVSNTNAESVYTSPTIYTSASGLHATINVGDGTQNCPAGNVGGEAIVSTLISPGQNPIAKVVWCTGLASGGGHMNYPPISTTTDGVSANALVWFVDGSQLRAVDADTGQAVLTTTGTACGGIPNMSFPIAVNSRIVVAAGGHLCSWSPNGTL
jgi:hypothetical protein